MLASNGDSHDGRPQSNQHLLRAGVSLRTLSRSAAVTAVLLAVVVVAILMPARRASRIPPVVAFRGEA